MIAQTVPPPEFTRGDEPAASAGFPTGGAERPPKASTAAIAALPQADGDVPPETPSKRLRLTDTVLAAIFADFEQHGAWAIERMRLEEPTQYVKLIVSLMPKSLINQFEQHRLGETSTVTPEELKELDKGKLMQQVVETVYTNNPPINQSR